MYVFLPFSASFNPPPPPLQHNGKGSILRSCNESHPISFLCMYHVNYDYIHHGYSNGTSGCDLCAQVALAGTQIWWTTEVNLSFARLEEGYENALKDYFKKQVHAS